MTFNDLIARFSSTPENQKKAIFSTLFIAGNRLQTLFDQRIPMVSLKQFMLLTIVRQSQDSPTFTQLGRLLGCSRQNIKKLADVLMKKGFVTIQQSPQDMRAMCVCLSEKGKDYFNSDFLEYQQELSHLFEVYTDQELETLFSLLSKLYDGIDNLENQTSSIKKECKTDENNCNL